MVESFIQFLNGMDMYDWILGSMYGFIYFLLKDILITLKSINEKIGLSYRD